VAGELVADEGAPVDRAAAGGPLLPLAEAALEGDVSAELAAGCLRAGDEAADQQCRGYDDRDQGQAQAVKTHPLGIGIRAIAL